MVHIAIAGGSGEVAQEILDALVATNKHVITIFTRSAKPATNATPGVTWRAVDYSDRENLVEALRGVHTVLSFVQILADPECKAQKNLIDAAIKAGVRRFAPSEWGSSGREGMPWWEGKDVVKRYLEEVNADGKVLEYTLFQPGWFLNYLATPHKTAKHVTPLNTMIDFENCRAVTVEGQDTVMTWTTVQDVAAIVARAVEYESEWPVVGGISGNTMPVSEVLKIGEKIRGRPFTIEKVKLEDIEAGEYKASFSLQAKHHAVSGEEANKMLRTVLIGTLIGSAKGSWAVSDAFNRFFPDYEFTTMKNFLTEVWQGKD